MSYETYHIPVNFTDAGKLFGVFEIRNAVETVLLCIPILFLCLALLPLTLMPKIIVTMTILVPVGGFALIGIGGERLSGYRDHAVGRGTQMENVRNRRCAYAQLFGIGQ